MKLAVMQPYFFPYIGYFQLLAAADVFVLYDDVTYIKGGWINRNRILVNGEANMFTVPLANAGSNILIKDLRVGKNIDKWWNKFARTLQCNYKKAPYYTDVMEIIRSSCIVQESSFIKWLRHSHQLIMQYLDIETALIESSKKYKNRELERGTRLIDIAKREKCDNYLNLPGGDRLYSKEEFSQQNVRLQFLHPCSVTYSQFRNEFVPNLSIIDVMMFNSPPCVLNLLNEYQLT